MGRQTIRRDALRFGRLETRKTRELLRRSSVLVVSIACDVNTGAVLAAGLDHAAVLRGLEKLGVPEGTWEMSEVQFFGSQQ
jgi:hypothetical protein